ncbi:peptidoglycan-binding protein [Streptomyces hundungensis]|uniref:peptidoglycan-binding protein n=1 Tax=Streptomyces hundungensis TaxID=1077946 RepID=UPI003406813A
MPKATVAFTLTSTPSGDDTARIQAALNKTAKLPAGPSGLRGAVLLAPGTFRVHASLALPSGVVLRGSGSNTGGTLLSAQGKPGSLITVGGTGTYSAVGKRVAVSDAYVPVGARSLTVDTPGSFHPGDQIIVQRPTTQNWINAIGMDQLPGEAWQPSSGILAARTITSVAGRVLTLDAPLTTALDKQYGGGSVWHYALDGQVTQAGIENLAADATAFTKDAHYGKPPSGASADSGAFAARLATFRASHDAWVSNVTLTHFGSGIWAESNASRITVEQVSDLQMAVPAGLSPPPAFMIGGQQILVKNTTVTGDNIHAWTTQAYAAGPNVFTQGAAHSLTGTGKVDAGPHLKWGSGTLYDQLSITGAQGSFIVRNDYDGGQSGHGWQGANTVFWNTSAARYTLQRPPTADNWGFGMTGTLTPGKHDADLPTPPETGTLVSPGAPVQPASLYTQQVLERH